TATACSSGDDSDKKADAKPAASDSAQGDDGKDRLGLPDKLPEDLPTSMKDLEGWKKGAWKDWDKDQW
ncbi:hypothetical protein AN219_25820, partial [Streptomyces nanshensis]